MTLHFILADFYQFLLLYFQVVIQPLTFNGLVFSVLARTSHVLSVLYLSHCFFNRNIKTRLAKTCPQGTLLAKSLQSKCFPSSTRNGNYFLIYLITSSLLLNSIFSSLNNIYYMEFLQQNKYSEVSLERLECH